MSDACRLKTLEDENTRLRKLLAEAMLDNAILKDVAAKKWCPTQSGMWWLMPAWCMVSQRWAYEALEVEHQACGIAVCGRTTASCERL